MTERMSITRDSYEQLRQIIEAMGQGVAAPRQPAIAATPQPPAQSVSAPTTDASFAFADYGKFYDFLRSGDLLGPKISQSEYDGCDNIIRACAVAAWPVAWVAYALATAYLETAHTMQPIKEIGGEAYFRRMYDINGSRPAKARELGNLTPGDGAKFAGRGYVQLTGKTNYRRATEKLRDRGFDVDLVVSPDRVMQPDIAAAIMVSGMREGWFTGRDIDDDLPSDGPATRQQFVVSRDIINGRDRDDEIAAYALDFQTGLQQAGYKTS